MSHLTPPKAKILIVDDSADNLQVLFQLLRDDYAVIAATTGEKAIKMAQKSPHPDLILLDVIMPNMDGYEVFTQLKANPETADISVIFITALNEGLDEAKGLDLGAIDYITKPFNPSVVKARIKNHLRLQNLNKELQENNQTLARVTRLKDEFLANMSHELRTPLNAILGMTEGLQDGVFGEVNPQQQKSLEVITRSSNHLLALINDILDVAKIESGKIELEWETIAVSSLCRSSLSLVKTQAYNKKIELVTQLSEGLPDLWGDERRIRQILINLLNNAVKFTPEGGKVILSAHLLQGEADEDSEGKEYLRITVKDTGIGISQEEQKQLFQPFVQIDSSLNRKYAGTGLGLTLVKQLVQLHGGRVSLQSDKGVGSCFRVDLPCVSVNAALKQEGVEFERSKEESQETRINSHPRILLVEDNEANIYTVSSYLKAKGYQVLFATNGEDGIEMAKTECPDAILMDIQMPGMDGLEAIQYIRELKRFVDVPIIALTALAMPEDRDRCLQAGANHYLSKPIKLKQLALTIQQLLQIEK
jgi:signal transduction histidine kinase